MRIIEFDPEREALFRQLWADRSVPFFELEKRFGHTGPTLRRIAASFDLPKRIVHEGWTPAFTEEIASLYLAGESPVSLARTYGLTRNTVVSKLKRLGVLRSNAEAQIVRGVRAKKKSRSKAKPKVEAAGAAGIVPTPRPSYRPAPGAVSAYLIANFTNPKSETPTEPLRVRILAELRRSDASTLTLATLLDAKELLIVQSLSAMEHEGIVSADPMPDAGRRAQRWRLRQAMAA
jgi:hypothetical protein